MQRWIFVAVLLVLFLAVGGMLLMRQRPQPEQRLEQALRRAEAEARSLAAVPAGKVVLLCYRQEGSRRTLAFETDVLGRLRQRFGSRIEVITSAGWHGLPSPTVIVRSHDAQTVHYMDVSFATLEQLINSELGEATETAVAADKLNP